MSSGATQKREGKSDKQDASRAAVEQSQISGHTEALLGQTYAEQSSNLQPPSDFEAVQQKGLGGYPMASQVQMLRPGGESATSTDAGVREAASQGLTGGGATMPHASTIQNAFGHHDIGGVSAHMDAPAQQASAAIGAEAYTVGDSVAFNSAAPSLHTTAHEAAHVIQQRGGVSVPGGVGAAGDSYETHADQVADTVVSGQSAESLLDSSPSGASAGAVQEKPVQRASADGITGGKVTRGDFARGQKGAGDTAAAQSAADAEDAMTLSQQVASIKTETARSEAEVLAAIKNGEMPRYIARVNSKKSFDDHNTFGNPYAPFVFATEPADLRGSTAIEGMLKVGWTTDWIQDKHDTGEKEIEVCILDTSVAVPPTADGSSPGGQVELGQVDWPEMKAQAMADPGFVAAMDASGVAPAVLPSVFDVAAATPVKGQPASMATEVAILREELDERFSANELYTGMGATYQETGELGGREVAVKENGTGLRLVSGNHQREELTPPLNQPDIDAIDPA